MAVYFHEIPESRELGFEPPTAVHHWVCEGLFDDLTMGNLARSATPTQWQHPLALLFRNDMQVKEVGHLVYNVTVNYGVEKKDIGSYRIEFDTLGGTVHVKAGVHVAVFPAGSPTHNGLIGANRADDIEGTDIVIPAMRVIVHFKHPALYLTTARVRALSRLCGAVDTEGIFGWDAYETLFLGAQGSQSVDLTTTGIDITEEVSYHFAMSENLVNFSIGSISGISKKGWDVAWLKWKPQVEGGKASNAPDYCNVVRVYKEKPLKTLLGIG